MIFFMLNRLEFLMLSYPVVDYIRMEFAQQWVIKVFNDHFIIKGESLAAHQTDLTSVEHTRGHKWSFTQPS